MRPHCGLSLALSTTSASRSFAPVQIRGTDQWPIQTLHMIHKIPEERNKPKIGTGIIQKLAKGRIMQLHADRTPITPTFTALLVQRSTTDLAGRQFSKQKKKLISPPVASHVMMGKCILSHTHLLASHISIISLDTVLIQMRWQRRTASGAGAVTYSMV